MQTDLQEPSIAEQMLPARVPMPMRWRSGPGEPVKRIIDQTRLHMLSSETGQRLLA